MRVAQKIPHSFVTPATSQAPGFYRFYRVLQSCRVESPSIRLYIGPRRSLHRSPEVAMSSSSIETLTASLLSRSIKPQASVSHEATTSPAAWRDALSAASSTPANHQLTKTLVFKPKTAKSAVPVPVVVIAREETDTNSAALGKKLNLKEMRLASADLLSEFFGLDKDSRTHYLILQLAFSFIDMIATNFEQCLP